MPTPEELQTERARLDVRVAMLTRDGEHSRWFRARRGPTQYVVSQGSPTSNVWRVNRFDEHGKPTGQVDVPSFAGALRLAWMLGAAV